jgi:hypothetical protein
MRRSSTESAFDRFRHEAVRDTRWIGKGVGSPWLVVFGIVALAAIAIVVFR